MEDLLFTKGSTFVLVAAFISGAAGAWLISRFASSMGLVDAPSARSSHVMPTPKGGGVGILAAFVLSCVAFGVNYLFCLSSTFLAILSLVGDRNHLPPSVRLVLQFVAAFIIIFGLPGSPFFIRLTFLSIDYSLLLLIFGGVLAAVYIVGTANFYNFMDGVNGIAAISGVVCFGLLAGYGANSGKDYRYVMLCMALAVACAGFLPFNVPKAKVFMGDVGSILLGFVFAVVVVKFTTTLSEFIVLTCFLFPFYADEVSTMVERIRMRQNITKPHRRHLYQVLANEVGVAHWKVAFGYGVVQLIIGLSAWQVSRFGLVALLVFVICLMCFGLAASNRAKSNIQFAEEV